MHTLTALLALLGLFVTVLQPQELALASDTQEPGKTVRVEVVGVYMRVDVDHVRETIEAQCEGTSRFESGWASGNRMMLELSSVPDIEAFARKITIGKVIGVDGQTIQVEYTKAGQIKPRPGRREEPPEDPLGPALRSHNGDLAAALRSIGAEVTRNPEQQIVKIEMPPLVTSDTTLSHLADLTSLKELDLAINRHITDEGAQHLANLVNLERLCLFGTRIGNPGQFHLRQLTKLKTLHLSGNGTEEGLQHLSNLRSMERLSIGFGRSYPVTEEGLRHLETMTKLKTLRLDGCGISDAGLRIIARFSDLEDLALQHGSMTDAGLVHLSHLRNLHSLSLSCCTNIGDSGLTHLRSLSKLRDLKLLRTRVTDMGITELAVFSDLQTIWLSGTAIADASLEILGQLPGIKCLLLDDTQITDLGLAKLGGLARLRELHIQNTRVTDEGLKHLRGCRELSIIRANGTEVSESALRQFAR